MTFVLVRTIDLLLISVHIVFDLKFATNVPHHYTTMLVFFAFKNQRYIVAVYSLHDADLYRRDSMAIGYSSDNQTLAELKLKTLSEWVSDAK